MNKVETTYTLDSKKKAVKTTCDSFGILMYIFTMCLRKLGHGMFIMSSPVAF